MLYLYISFMWEPVASLRSRPLAPHHAHVLDTHLVLLGHMTTGFGGGWLVGLGGLPFYRCTDSATSSGTTAGTGTGTGTGAATGT